MTKAEGDKVTAVMANAPGALELLPNEAYGNGWLEIPQQGRLFKALPERGDPYEEIYLLRGKWYALLRDEWINPGRVRGAGFARTAKYLQAAKAFHRVIASTYHPLTYAHYGADRGRPAYGRVVWELDPGDRPLRDVEGLRIARDDKEGCLKLVEPGAGSKSARIEARILPPADPGDETVPIRSSDGQLHSGRCRAVFCQTGYEHQDSYKDGNVLAATLYSIIKIVLEMKWSECAS